MVKNVILALWGASASGKTSLANYLAKHDGFTQIKTCTTRAKRTPREDDYHFVTVDQFKRMHTFAGTHFAGNYYGSSLDDVKHLFAAGHHKLVIILTWSGIVNYVHEFRHSDVRVCPAEVYATQRTILSRLRKRDDSHMTNGALKTRLQSYRQQAKTAEVSPINSCILNSYPRSKQENLARQAGTIHNLLY